MANILNTANTARKSALARRNEDTDVALAISPRSELGMTVSLRYDYEKIPSEHRAFVQNAAADLTTKFERRRRESIGMGKALIEVRDRIGDGLFVDWLMTEFDMSKSTAYNAIAIFERFGGYPEAPKLLTDAAMLKMASPKVPETVVRTVIEEAKATGKSPSAKRVDELIAASKPGKKKATPATIDSVATPVSAPKNAGDILAFIPGVERMIAGYESLTGDAETARALLSGLAKIRQTLSQ